MTRMTDEEFDRAVEALDAEDEAMILEFKRKQQPAKPSLPVLTYDEWVFGLCTHVGIDAFQ